MRGGMRRGAEEMGWVGRRDEKGMRGGMGWGGRTDEKVRERR